jgi:hypothetical protein
LLVTAVYFAVSVGEPYLRYYRFLDGMKQEARFSARFTDDQIQARLAARRFARPSKPPAGCAFDGTRHLALECSSAWDAL